MNLEWRGGASSPIEVIFTRVSGVIQSLLQAGAFVQTTSGLRPVDGNSCPEVRFLILDMLKVELTGVFTGVFALGHGDTLLSNYPISPSRSEMENSIP